MVSGERRGTATAIFNRARAFQWPSCVGAGKSSELRPFASVGDGLRRSDTAVREWVGLAVYWLTGRSSELFPAPTQDGH